MTRDFIEIFLQFLVFPAGGAVWFLLNRRLASLEEVTNRVPINYVTREHCKLLHSSSIDVFNLSIGSVRKDLRILLENGEIKNLRVSIDDIKDRLARIETRIEGM